MASAQLTLVCHAATAATRAAAFPADEPLDESGWAAARAARGRWRRVDQVWCGAALRARQTAEAMGLAATCDPALADLDHGRWAGRSLEAVATADPAAAAAWLSDPEAAPHGGESIAALIGRVAGWLAFDHVRDGRVVAVTHAAVMRAAIVVALDASPAAFWRVDIAPLGQVRMRFAAGRWTLRAVERS